MCGGIQLPSVSTPSSVEEGILHVSPACELSGSGGRRVVVRRRQAGGRGAVHQTATAQLGQVTVRTRVQMLVLPRTSAVVAFFSSCLWASVWERALLQPTRAGAFLLGSGGPTLLLPRHQAAQAVARYATRSQQRQLSARRGGSEPMVNMCLRMAPSQPHPTKVAFQVSSAVNRQRPPSALCPVQVN